MKIESIKPIPKYIATEIKKADKTSIQDGKTRFYAYLTKNNKELVKVTVAVRNFKGKWHCKQCAVHGLNSDKCFCRDIEFYYIGGYSVSWQDIGAAKKWYGDGKWYEALDKYFDPYAPIVNKNFLAKFPNFKYSAYELYTQYDILQYLRLYEKYPQTEMLLKLGLSTQFVKSKQILKLVGKDKKFRKWLCLHRSDLQQGFYYTATVLKAYKENKPLPQVQKLEQVKKSLHDTHYKPIRDLFKADFEKYVAYIEKQNISHSLYLDYLNACNYLNLDMTDIKNRFPHDFMRWHDIRTNEYTTAKALKDREERKALYNKFKSIAKKYSALQHNKKSDFVVFIAQSPADLIREGKMLNHCVGKMDYDQRFIKEQSLIFFVRERANQDTPFVTLEYSLTQKKVLQCYGDHDSKPDIKVTDYVNKVWIPYVNRNLKKIAV